MLTSLLLSGLFAVPAEPRADPLATAQARLSVAGTTREVGETDVHRLRRGRRAPSHDLKLEALSHRAAPCGMVARGRCARQRPGLIRGQVTAELVP